MDILTRDKFRESVFERDNHKCVICGDEAADAHHIMERRLFPKETQGYFIENGSSLCPICHILAEQTLISPQELRDKIGIKNIILPPQLYRDAEYDKWGNEILQNSTRLKGELFFDESVQKILKEGGVLNSFTNYIKYPRTYHLPWSPGTTKDDRIMKDIDTLLNNEVVITLKMDGENCNLYFDKYHARSLDGLDHPSRNWLKNFHSKIAHDIPEGWRICGENLYAKHSIHYENLKTYFYGFSIWDEKNNCLSWEETLYWFLCLDIEPVECIYTGNITDEIISNKFFKPYEKEHEGYVIRTKNSFNYRDFRKCVGKYVRENHVQTSHGWRYEQIVKNEIGNDI